MRAVETVGAHVGTGADVPTLVQATPARDGTSQVTDDDLPQLARKALVQLGFSSAIAIRAVEAANAHVGSGADVPTLVHAALTRGGTSQVTDEDLPQLARKALVQLGFSSAISIGAVEVTSAHVGSATDLGALIKEALRWCR